MNTNKHGYPTPETVAPDVIEQDRKRAYWRANIRLIRTLLIIWAFVSLGCSILFVPLLNNIMLGNVPLGFWMAQQGSIFTFVILIFVYAIQMDVRPV
ncbi:conserved hypothetical protein [Hyella patelloides LEGE 07179]|uniref:Sodium symporter small subunit domain-containing protein n=1 Tax=Hyella patelloides LEGE 07179 TaxID=945734 RepID=A0A563VQM4_9CYAN|nr:DUF4212 domain-containing protein [Hyella patelloides]VEP13567.1 conserved hypothetical protein [Hyella patelloides LEGE 07179]